MTKRFTTEEVKKYVSQFNYELLSEYKGIDNKITLKCPIGHIYDVRYNNFKNNNRRCPYCKGDVLSKHFRAKEEEILEKIKENELEYVSGIENFKNGNSKIKVKCKHGHIYETRYSLIKKGNGCRKCYGTQKLTIDEIRDDLSKYNYKLISDVYVNANEKLLMKCEYGHAIQMSWNKFQQGRRCSVCNCSQGENKIRLYLENNNIEYIQEHRFKNCKDKYTLPFDFYLPKLNIAIEYDGEFHYKDIHGELNEQIRRDNIKTNYCKLHDIRLIRIPYWEFDNIDNILKDINE